MPHRTFTFTGRLRSLIPHASCLVIVATSIGWGTAHDKDIECGPTKNSATVEPAGLNRLDAAQLQQMLTAGEITSMKLVQAYLARINAYDKEYGDQPGLDAVIQLNEHALQDAKKLDEERANGHVRGPFHGVPVLLKEIYNVKGMPTPAGLGEMMKNIVAPEDAFIVRKLREAGAIILAHTDAWSANAGNPFDQTLNPGGSSAGNAAGLAAAYAPIAIGEDSLGSARIPAAWTSTVGFRPTMGLVSMNGAAPIYLTYDTPGPQATTVQDVARLMDVIAVFDPNYPSSVKMDMPSTYTQHLDKDYLKGRKIGIYAPFMLDSDDTVRRVIENAAAELEQLGAKVVTLHDGISPVERPPAGMELLREIAGNLGLNHTAGFEEGSEFGSATDLWLSTLRADDSELAKRAAPKDKLTRADLYAAQGTTAPASATPADYRRHARLRGELRAWFKQIVTEQGVDAVIYPTVRKLPQPRKRGYMWQNTSLAPLLGYPAISVPAGFVDGLPVGLDIMGTAPGQDAEILGMAYAYEQGTHHRRAPASTPPLAGERDLLKQPGSSPQH
jgi:amidase